MKMKFATLGSLAAGAALLLSTVVAAQPANAATPCIQQTLKQGWANNKSCVVDLQYMINQTHIISVDTDGVFGGQTTTAVRYLQHNTNYGLTVDGVVGPKTWAALCDMNGPTGFASHAGCRW